MCSLYFNHNLFHVVLVNLCRFSVRELIRKKALMVMHRFYLLSPTSITHLYKDFRRCLSDSDPGVMDTVLVLLYDLVKVCTMSCTCYFCIASTYHIAGSFREQLILLFLLILLLP